VRIVGSAKGLTDLGREVAPGLYESELRYLRDYEWARTAEDVMWRRSKLGLHLPAGTLDTARAALDAWFADGSHTATSTASSALAR
jgi:glycerol-3-phosphate dehydrogenase